MVRLWGKQTARRAEGVTSQRAEGLNVRFGGRTVNPHQYDYAEGDNGSRHASGDMAEAQLKPKEKSRLDGWVLRRDPDTEAKQHYQIS